MSVAPHLDSVLLLVEDESVLRLDFAETLEAAGFIVVAVADGSQAISVLDNDVPDLKAIVTDVRLGSGPSGWDVGRHAREVNSSIPVIYMSGDSAHEWSAQGVPESLMLQKPFVSAQLITAVTSSINQVTSTVGSGATSDRKS